MIKILLGLSLIVNAVQGYFLLTRAETTEVIERVIIETHAEKSPTPPSGPSPSQEKVTKAPKESEKKIEELPHFMPAEFQDAGEKMEGDRNEYLVQKLGMSDEKLAEHNRLRIEFYQDTAAMWPKNSMRELTFEERRKMIDLEEAFHKKLEKLHGKKNWERYQKYREQYNEKGFKLQTEENRPFVFMGI